jgi:hypothetical protein
VAGSTPDKVKQAERRYRDDNREKINARQRLRDHAKRRHARNLDKAHRQFKQPHCLLDK